MALRAEFETEWENDSELLVAELEFLPEDTETEKAAKLELLKVPCRGVVLSGGVYMFDGVVMVSDSNMVAWWCGDVGMWGCGCVVTA